MTGWIKPPPPQLNKCLFWHTATRSKFWTRRPQMKQGLNRQKECVCVLPMVQNNARKNHPKDKDRFTVFLRHIPKSYTFTFKIWCKSQAEHTFPDIIWRYTLSLKSKSLFHIFLNMTVGLMYNPVFCWIFLHRCKIHTVLKCCSTFSSACLVEVNHGRQIYVMLCLFAGISVLFLSRIFQLVKYLTALRGLRLRWYKNKCFKIVLCNYNNNNHYAGSM